MKLFDQFLLCVEVKIVLLDGIPVFLNFLAKIYQCLFVKLSFGLLVRILLRQVLHDREQVIQQVLLLLRQALSDFVVDHFGKKLVASSTWELNKGSVDSI